MLGFLIQQLETVTGIGKRRREETLRVLMGNMTERR